MDGHNVHGSSRGRSKLRLRRRSLPITALLVVVAVALVDAAVGFGASPRPTVLVFSAGQIAQQEVTPASGSEPDTLVEPDMAVSPLNARVVVTAAHEGRFPDGGATAISHAWTRDGGLTWQHGTVTGLTKASGGVWDRVSDPILAFAPNGNVYLSTIAFNSSPTDCNSVVLVSRSRDGGATFGPPMTAQATNNCSLFNDKNTIVVDDGARSPHRGRIYQFWTFFHGRRADQVLRFSDDHGKTWSRMFTAAKTGTSGSQNSVPMVQQDGTLTDTYMDFRYGDGSEELQPEKSTRQWISSPRSRAATGPGTRVREVTSRDGGRTWSTPVTVARHVGFGPDNVRCCLPSAAIDPVTDRRYVTWMSVHSRRVLLAHADHKLWSDPVRVSPLRPREVLRVNSDVTAYGAKVLVSYGTYNTAVQAGRYWRQQLSVSLNDGRSFQPPTTVGPRYDTRYAAQAFGIFPGDYIGTASSRHRAYATWALASKPSDPTAAFHQTLYGVSLLW